MSGTKSRRSAAPAVTTSQPKKQQCDSNNKALSQRQRVQSQSQPQQQQHSQRQSTLSMSTSPGPQKGPSPQGPSLPQIQDPRSPKCCECNKVGGNDCYECGLCVKWIHFECSKIPELVRQSITEFDNIWVVCSGCEAFAKSRCEAGNSGQVFATGPVEQSSLTSGSVQSLSATSVPDPPTASVDIRLTTLETEISKLSNSLNSFLQSASSAPSQSHQQPPSQQHQEQINRQQQHHQQQQQLRQLQQPRQNQSQQGPEVVPISTLPAATNSNWADIVAHDSTYRGSVVYAPNGENGNGTTANGQPPIAVFPERSSANITIGTADSATACPLKGVATPSPERVPRAVFYARNFALDTSADVIKSHLSANNITCTSVTMFRQGEHTDRQSCRIVVYKAHAQSMRCSWLWPVEVVVRDWKFKSKQSVNSNSRHSNNDNNRDLNNINNSSPSPNGPAEAATAPDNRNVNLVNDTTPQD